MSFLLFATTPRAQPSRRAFLGRSSVLLSGTAVALAYADAVNDELRDLKAILYGGCGDLGEDVRIGWQANVRHDRTLVSGSHQPLAQGRDRKPAT